MVEVAGSGSGAPIRDASLRAIALHFAGDRHPVGHSKYYAGPICLVKQPVIQVVGQFDFVVALPPAAGSPDGGVKPPLL